MNISVVLKDGKECAVRKDEFQFLMVTRQIMFFKRSEGWTVIGRDKTRNQKLLYQGEERRDLGRFPKDTWY
jgi:hypothetical protein